jgi:hypothetical protein
MTVKIVAGNRGVVAELRLRFAGREYRGSSYSMTARHVLVLALLLMCPAATLGQVEAAPAVSSDDISVAEGLQLPAFGHIWMLDTWKGVKELIQLHRPDDAVNGHAFSIKLHRVIEVRGEAAAIRIHDRKPSIFMHEVNTDDSGEAHADFAVVRMRVSGNRREAPQQAADEIAAKGKGKTIQSADVIELTQQRVGETDWYRLTAKQPLDPGEYVLVPWTGTASAALDEIYDFAIDPDAPENAEAVRSEADQHP